MPEQQHRNWWEGKLVPALTAVVIPMTAAIVGPCTARVSKDKELEIQTKKDESALQLQKEKQSNDIRSHYLELAIDPDRAPLERQQVLRFLVEAEKEADPYLFRWAQGELTRVNER